MNFDFIKQFTDFDQLYNYCSKAETYVLSDCNISVSQARSAIEYIIKFMYHTNCRTRESKTIFEMLNDQTFIDYINSDDYMNSLHYIRKMGNIAVHVGNITKEEAISVLEELHYVVGEFFYMVELIEDYPEFESPTANKIEPIKKDVKVEKEVLVEDGIIAKYGNKMRYTKFSAKHKRDESENKRLFLLASLTDSGWKVLSKPNISMPCSAGINMMINTGDTCDFILYGKDNKPLAIIEYTATINSLLEGRQKACQKADSLEKKYGYKPIVYYTNGYYIYCIDQLGYEPRRVFNFHTIDELEWLLFQRTNRKDITSPAINEAIVDREYQKKSITAICNAFASLRRKSLLVLATGTGKTRVSIATVEVLLKTGWIKNVLFLADRTSLVKQAHKNYNKLLPNVPTSIYTGDSQDRDENAKIIFSTYQTMINLINEDTKEFSVGRFDLIIIDEAHRSIFKKYKSIFEYFDSLMLGLTATPRNEENKSTYDIFNLPNGEPDYAYELIEAINDKYLVGFAIIDKTTDALRRGISYDSLTDEEKKKIEELFDSEEIEENLTPNGRIINIGTIDAMLNDLMSNGLKIEGGDTLGKTIIFAKSHAEATVIVDRFQHLYPYLNVDFCKLIDSRVENSQNNIEKFEVRGGMPNVAVSVDMLDTGIDVPDILNLVFFKTIKSKIKFLQMIGRGTRLSRDIFGPTLDKKGFVIFDYYDNFRYFSEKNTWSTVKDNAETSFNVSSATCLLNRHKLSILQGLQFDKNLNAFETKHMNELKRYFIDEVQSLVNDNVAVQLNMAYVSKYRTPEIWDKITDKQKEEIITKIIPLIPSNGDNPKIKSFDLAMLVIEETFMENRRQGKADSVTANSLSRIVKGMNHRIDQLLKLKSIPEIVNKTNTLKEMIDCQLVFNNFTLENTENVRKELRGLMIYLPERRGFVIINQDDYVAVPSTGGDDKPVKSYKEKVTEYLADNKNPILAKIMNLDELTKEEQTELSDDLTVKLGSDTEFKNLAKGLALLPFVRLQVGFTDIAVKNKFGSFLNSNILNTQQLTFCNQIIEYTKINGDFTPILLQKVSPFCDVEVVNLFGTKFTYVKQLIAGLHKPVEWKK